MIRRHEKVLEDSEEERSWQPHGNAICVNNRRPADTEAATDFQTPRPASTYLFFSATPDPLRSFSIVDEDVSSHDRTHSQHRAAPASTLNHLVMTALA